MFKQALEAVDLSTTITSHGTIRKCFNHGVPVFAPQSDIYKVLVNETQHAAAYVALVPEPSNPAMADLIEIYKAFPTDVQFYGTVLYVGYIVLGLGDGLAKFIPNLEKAWRLRSFDDKAAFFDLMKD